MARSDEGMCVWADTIGSVRIRRSWLDRDCPRGRGVVLGSAGELVHEAWIGRGVGATLGTFGWMVGVVITICCVRNNRFGI